MIRVQAAPEILQAAMGRGVGKIPPLCGRAGVFGYCTLLSREASRLDLSAVFPACGGCGVKSCVRVE